MAMRDTGADEADFKIEEDEDDDDEDEEEEEEEEDVEEEDFDEESFGAVVSADRGFGFDMRSKSPASEPDALQAVVVVGAQLDAEFSGPIAIGVDAAAAIVVVPDVVVVVVVAADAAAAANDDDGVPSIPERIASFSVCAVARASAGGMFAPSRERIARSAATTSSGSGINFLSG
ncbi:Hypothetical Protein FCC1311_009112 [Hondaea fermentalgiana]|uniref:Uncharacterized protein n=1 Tax=Hondaea fermentalgiana TaxID=2315210 RepID=A0A2R5G881_9STRA|nr:Hypothetical Protein FCC1311_009112 [Hondaea fermentalgiana]|eukprot:GBG24693.1 Hypothetical Protein FCC1311_009112 [Hondaea fermentalgiana]